MSFNNQLNFNISKSTPTISTTNETTVSGKSSSGSGAIDIPNPGTNSSKAPFFNSILSKSSATMSSSSTKTDSAEIVLKDSNKDTDNQANNDLIGLFDKFDIKSKEVTQSGEPHLDKEDKGELHPDKEDKETIADKMSTNEESSVISKGDSIKDSDTESNTSLNEKDTMKSVKKDELLVEVQQPSHERNQELLEGNNVNQNSSDNSTITNNVDGHLSNVSEESNENNTETNEATNEADSLKQNDLLDITDDQSSPVEEYVPPNEEGNSSRLSERPTGRRTRTNSQRGSISEITRKTQALVKPEEQYQQSHRPFDFQNFLGQLRRKQADPIVRYIRSFLVSFIKQVNNSTAEQKVKVINDFKNFINEKFLLYEPFASMDEIDLENSREGLEKLIMNRLYDQCFPPEIQKRVNGLISETFHNDLKADREFETIVEKYSWVNGTHLDIDLDYLTDLNKGSKPFMDYAIEELNKINNYRAPRDKIICILNSCKIIFSFLKVNRQETNADSFIPLLILVIIKAKTDNIICNIHYIERFRGEEWLSHGETCYYLSSLEGAIEFIKNLGFDDLTISEEEYRAHMEAWDAERARRITEEAQRKLQLAEPVPIHSNDPNSEDLSHPHSLSPSNVLMTSAEMFTKSISQFLSPSPVEESRVETHVNNNNNNNNSAGDDSMKDSYKKMREIFPDLDKSILKDIVVMNKGDIDNCLEACLQLTNEV